MRESKILIPYEASLTWNGGDRYNAAYLLFTPYQWTLSEKWFTSSKSNGYNGWYITFLFKHVLQDVLLTLIKVNSSL